MYEEIIIEHDVDAVTYLKALQKNYPYDIEDRMVHSLLTEAPTPHPALLAFLTYTQMLTKYHLLTKQIESNSLQHLFTKMSKLAQQNTFSLCTYHYQFDATIYIKQQRFRNPYAHLPLQDVAFLSHLELHNILTLNMKTDYIPAPIHKSNHFIYRDISIDANNYLAIAIKLTDKVGIIFIPKASINFIVAIATLYEVVETPLHVDFMLIHGYWEKHFHMNYYFDQTNELYIGLVNEAYDMHHILYVRDMISTLYNSICIEKHDLPVHASMLLLEQYEKQLGMLFIGSSTTGKSEMMYAMQNEVSLRKAHSSIHYDDIGTLHYFDNAIVSTGLELAACQYITQQRHPLTLTNMQHSIFISEQRICKYQITPFTTYAHTCQFQSVDIIFLLDHTTKQSGYRMISDLHEALSLCITTNQLHSDMDDTFFMGSYGCAQQAESCEQLIKDFLTILFVQNIPIYLLSIKKNGKQKEMQFQRMARQILDELIDANDC